MDDEAHVAELEAAFSRGDYARVTKDARVLAEKTTDEKVRARAALLTRKVSPDPIAIVLFVIAAILLAAMTVYFEMRSR
ncbi:MAG: hypothetical protein ABI461_05550 [Polyangiaceae bacterium]